MKQHVVTFQDGTPELVIDLDGRSLMQYLHYFNYAVQVEGEDYAKPFGVNITYFVSSPTNDYFVVDKDLKEIGQDIQYVTRWIYHDSLISILTTNYLFVRAERERQELLEFVRMFYSLEKLKEDGIPCNPTPSQMQACRELLLKIKR